MGAPLLHDLAEGIDRDHLPMWRLIVVVGCAFIGAIGTIYRTRREACPRCSGSLLVPIEPEPDPAGTTRRAVLRASTAAAAATVGGAAGMVLPNRRWIGVGRDFFATRVEEVSANPDASWLTSTIRSYRRLGRTNVMVSDISLGVGAASATSTSRAAPLFERGVTYFDTSPDYSDTGSEQLLGQAMQGPSRQDLPGDEVLPCRRPPAERHARDGHHRRGRGRACSACRPTTST